MFCLAFDDPLRNELKRRFATCAGTEATALEVDRRNGVPTLIIVPASASEIGSHAGQVVREEELKDPKWRASVS